MKLPIGIRLRGNSIQTTFPDPKNPGKTLVDSEAVESVTQTIVNSFGDVRKAFLIEWKLWSKNPQGPSPYNKYYSKGNNANAFAFNGGDQLTIKERFEIYHNDRVNEAKIEHSTLISNKSEMDLLCEHFGNKYLSELTLQDIQDMINNVTVTKKTIKNRLDHLKAIMYEAMTANIMEKNILVDWKPKFKKCHDSTYQKQAYTPDEIMAILTTAKKTVPQYYAMLLFHATMGLRCGEVYGLKWKYVNELLEQVEIVETRVNNKQKKNPKTNAGKRLLKLNAFSLAAIKAQRPLTFDPEKLVFQNINAKNSDLAWGDKSAPRQWRKVIKEAQIRDLTTKVLRHSFATMAFDTDKLPIEALSSILGHSDIKVTIENYIVKNKLKPVETAIIETVLDASILDIMPS